MGIDSIVPVDGADIAVRVDGPRDAPAIMLLNMAGCNLRMWDFVAETLARSRRVVRHDVRGTGSSEHHLDSSALTLRRFADDADTVRSAVLGDAPLLVVGAAFGTRIAVRLAGGLPGAVRGLAAFNAGLGPPAASAEFRRSALLARHERRRLGAVEPDPPAGYEEHRDGLAARRSAAVAKRDRAGLALWRTVRCPTVLVAGQHDPNLRACCQIAAAMPIALLEVVPGSGHATVLERPQLAIEIIESLAASTVG